ncbi:hypothetical protein EPI10_028193 [Gossypium australe]|uniref:Uncharacterized protein n=1 Tax=Gossypium australe TaxID=47621 RepID=A0A5B6UWK9_9ROSI|nr:hypothetical protein EPI10_028193 [Gossypium australe]
MKTFYIGLNAHTRMIVDTLENGAFLSKSYNEVYEIIKRISSNNYQWPTNRVASGRRVVGVHEVDAIIVYGFNGQQFNQFENISFEYCGDGHFF